MQIIYSYSNCKDAKYRELFADGSKLVLRADQKYHSLLIRGLSENGIAVKAISSLPINRRVKRNLLINEPDEQEGKVIYHYYKTVNLPVLRQLTVFFAGFFNMLKAKNKESHLICDYQNLANAYGTLLAAKIKGIRSTVIVMDLPDFLSGNRFVQKLYSSTFQLADSFILLTEQMNEIVNPKDKPHIVVEGIADYTINPINDAERFENTIGKKIVIYAGSIAKLYGIQNLVEGFVKANIPDSELWIYGDGDYKEELLAECKEQTNVIYKGICPNESVVYDEQRAALLINPRPTAPDYTKYSFPSKNMEYMASGTPVLTTKLPGMPTEYYNFVYPIEDDSTQGISEAISRVLAKNTDDRVKLGVKAQCFVRNEKSSIVQAERIIKFLQKGVQDGKEV